MNRNRLGSLETGSLAYEALCLEVLATPKPGLVDRNNSGAHRDMDCGLFLRSAHALFPHFIRFAQFGYETAALAPTQAFHQLRSLGREAEAAMFQATGGVNTHKGAIFSLGVLCAAAGRLQAAGRPCGSLGASLFREAAAMASGVSKELSCGAATHGQQAFRACGALGVRGEVEQGFPSVWQYGLPVLQSAFQAGACLDFALCVTLASLMAHVEDTNVLSRAGQDGAAFVQRTAGDLFLRRGLPWPQFQKELLHWDEEYIRRNVSPGGCADLLAATCFVWRLCQHWPTPPAK